MYETIYMFFVAFSKRKQHTDLLALENLEAKRKFVDRFVLASPDVGNQHRCISHVWICSFQFVALQRAKSFKLARQQHYLTYSI